MRLFYSLYFWTVFILTSLIFYVYGLLSGKKRHEEWQNLAIKALGFLFWSTFIKIKVKGRENLTKEPVIFCANHESFLDGLLVLYVTKTPFVAITAPYQIFPVFLSIWFKRMGFLGIGRDLFEELRYKNIILHQDCVDKGVDILQKGHSILIFPEGRREFKKRLLPFHMGISKICLKSKTPVVPITLKGVDTLFPAGTLLLTLSNVEVFIGKPVKLWKISKDFAKDALYLEKKIKQHLPKSYFDQKSIPHYPEGRRAAFFDLDGTLTKKNIYPLILLEYLNHHLSLDNLKKVFGLGVNRLILRHGFFYLSAIRLLKGIDYQSLMGHFQLFLRKKRRQIFNLEMLELLELHRAQGNLLFLITEEPDVIALPVARFLKMKGFGTGVVLLDGKFTGEISGHILKDEMKRDLLLDLAKKYQIDLSKSFAYGNSWHDYPMLRMVGHAYLVNPPKSLAKRGKQLGFRVV